MNETETDEKLSNDDIRGGRILETFFNKNKQGDNRNPAKSLNDVMVDCNNRVDGKPCWEKKGTTLTRKRKVPPSSRIGSSIEDDNNSLLKSAVSTFLSSGCCIIPRALPSTFTTSCKSKVTQDLEFLQEQLSKCKKNAISNNNVHLMSRVSRGDFRELVDRDGRRRDIRFQLDRFPFTCPGLVYNSIVYPLVKELLGGNDDVNLLYAGIMWALPFTDDQKKHSNQSNSKGTHGTESKQLDIDGISQKWHGDGGHLFQHVHLPPHCINVFYPLVDIKQENGPTDVMIGTHRLGHFKDENATQLSLTCNVGDAILFDYRLKHRGGVNLSMESRPVLYLAYAKPFFRDGGNTRSAHSVFTKNEEGAISPPWVSRVLTGDAVLYGDGFNIHEQIESNTCNSHANKCSMGNTIVPATTNLEGSGERWILLKMNVEIPNCDEPKVITIYHGDVATEVSTQFCQSHDLGVDFITVLASAIQSQMDDAIANTAA